MAISHGDPNVSIAWHIWVGTIATIVPATIAVALRLLSRRISVGCWWDDFTIVLALILNWAMAACRWAQCLLYEYGHHAHFVSKIKVIKFWKSFLAVQITYFSDAVLTKTSILLLYHRIFGVVHGFRTSLFIAAGIIWSYFVACFIVAIAGCKPVSYFWNKQQPGGCIDEVNFFRWNGISNLLMDVMVLCLPIPMIWGLKMEVKQRLILCVIFLLGAFVCLTSIFRIIAFNRSNTKDPTYTTVDTAMWSSIEQSVGIVCACLPTLRPLFTRVWGRSDATNAGSSGRHTARTRPRSRSQALPLYAYGEAPSGWKTGSSEDGRTVLPDEDQAWAGALQQRSRAYPFKPTVHATVAATNNDMLASPPTSQIEMTTEIHQRSDAI